MDCGTDTSSHDGTATEFSSTNSTLAELSSSSESGDSVVAPETTAVNSEAIPSGNIDTTSEFTSSAPVATSDPTPMVTDSGSVDATSYDQADVGSTDSQSSERNAPNEVVRPKITRVGDGVVQSQEECDDGNSVDVDGCTRQCQRTPGLRVWYDFNAGAGNVVSNVVDATGATDGIVKHG